MAQQGILTKDIALYYATTKPTTIGDVSLYTELDYIRQVPALGGTAEQVDVTCLRDEAFKRIKGLKDFGELEFTLLYDNDDANANFRILSGLEAAGTEVFWCVEFPDGATFAFSGECAVETSEAEPNNPIEFTLRVFLNSDMTITNPV